jgi:ubiquinone/menaquinone biosynthesis C-methylase UbiE
VTVVAGTAEAISARDGTYDAAVASLMLCSVPDQATALAELRRVIHPGGELRFYEHVRSPDAWIGHLQDAIDPAWRRAFGGCHTNRNTADAIQAAGFEITDITRLAFGVTHILGRARRP